jgi:hypothetical protein
MENTSQFDLTCLTFAVADFSTYEVPTGISQKVGKIRWPVKIEPDSRRENREVLRLSSCRNGISRPAKAGLDLPFQNILARQLSIFFSWRVTAQF